MCESWPPARLLHALITLQLAMRCPLCSDISTPVARCTGIGGLPVPSDESVIPATHCPQRPASSGHRP
jgi:hypothetical protein